MHIYRKKDGVIYGAETADIYSYYCTNSLRGIPDLFHCGQSPGFFYQRTINDLHKENKTIDLVEFSNLLFPCMVCNVRAVLQHYYCSYVNESIYLLVVNKRMFSL